MDPVTGRPYEHISAHILYMLTHDNHGWCFFSIPGTLFYITKHYHNVTPRVDTTQLRFNLSFKDGEKGLESSAYTRLYARWLYTGGCPQDLATVHPNGSVSFSLETRAALYFARLYVLQCPLVNGIPHDPVNRVKPALDSFFAGVNRESNLEMAARRWPALLDKEPVEDMDRLWHGVWPDPRVVYKKYTADMMTDAMQHPAKQVTQVNQVRYGALTDLEDRLNNTARPSLPPLMTAASSPSSTHYRPWVNDPAPSGNQHCITWTPKAHPAYRKYNAALYAAFARGAALRKSHISPRDVLISPPPVPAASFKATVAADFTPLNRATAESAAIDRARHNARTTRNPLHTSVASRTPGAPGTTYRAPGGAPRPVRKPSRIVVLKYRGGRVHKFKGETEEQGERRRAWAAMESAAVARGKARQDLWWMTKAFHGGVTHVAREQQLCMVGNEMQVSGD
ncbi:hypothetical protein MBLNU459_g8267t1 [Dothideomycetes sp. NU459]